MAASPIIAKRLLFAFLFSKRSSQQRKNEKSIRQGKTKGNMT
jgi:hypothetical protein